MGSITYIKYTPSPGAVKNYIERVLTVTGPPPYESLHPLNGYNKIKLSIPEYVYRDIEGV